MPTVELRDIVTDEDRAAALQIRRGPGQDRFVASVEKSFRDAIDDVRAMPRMWTVHDTADKAAPPVGFVMISDNIPAGILAAEPDLIGPYYLWRLLIDERFQRRGYGRATLDAVVDYVWKRPGADILWVSCGQEEGTPRPFYERYGFAATDRVVEDEIVLWLGLTHSGSARP